MEITKDGILKLWNREASQPCLQVIDVKQFGTDVSNLRYKAKLTDGDLVSDCVVPQPLAQQIRDGRIVVHCLLRVTDWTVQDVPKKKGSMTQCMFLSGGDVLGILPEERRANLYQLRQYPERAVGMSQMSQMPPVQHAAANGASEAMTQPGAPPMAPQPLAPEPLRPHSAPWQSAAYETTPERRPGVLGAEQTPNPPQQPGMGAEARMQNASPYSCTGAATSTVGAPGVGSSMPSEFNAHAQAAPAITGAPAATLPNAQQSVPAGAGQSAAPAGNRPLSSGLANYFQPRAAVSSSTSPAGSAHARPPWQSSGLGFGASRASSAGDASCIPISELSPYTQGRWKIKGRLTGKEAIRKFTNARGEGQLFKIEIRDRAGSEIDATFFGRAVDKYYESLRPGQVYYFSRGSIKPANKRFDRGEFVITFDEATIVEPAEEDRDIPGIAYNFRTFEDVHGLDVNENVDVKGVIIEARDVFNITLRSTQKERSKREIVLWDDSGDGGCSMELTVWGDPAHEEFPVGTVMYARGARVSEWNGAKTLNFSRQFELNPDDPQAFALLRAYEAAGRPQGNPRFGGASRGPSGPRETLEECREADLQLGPPPMQGQPPEPGSVNRHTVCVTMTCISQDRVPYYMSCPELVERRTSATQATQGAADRRPCNRKVTQDAPGSWRCSAGHVCSKPVARYMCQRVQVLDHSGSMEVGFFDDAGRKIFGRAADDLVPLWEDVSREADREEFVKSAAWKRVVLRLRAAKELWQEEERTKVTAEDAQTIDYVKEGKRMLGEVLAAAA